MTINLIDARRGLHNKCLELFADKNIAEQIYRYLCDGIEDCEEVEPVKHGQWVKRGDNSWECSICHEISCCNGNYCVDCGAKMDTPNDAHWIKQLNGEYKCSVCGDTTLAPLYECGTCGAKMSERR